MQIILREDLQGKGKAGEIIEVKDGFARNYLIPQGIAFPATDSFINVYKEEEKSTKRIAEKLRKGAISVQAALEGKVFTLKVKSGEEGKLFGSVTSQNIVDEVAKVGIELDKKKLKLDDNIKEIGEFEVPYKIHPEVDINIKVVVEAEEEATEE
ncbi:MAG: 50S ribosomal protein L9 [Candidatus Cloacimonadota bacterium]|nr:MAG: 50S ribosomal protein L9 [Candidatus Cloacimonadota bacterium]PIE79027.1 MAG: 50S ribosomal protein L9 [Candidatus Delongbacteria bacterium]